MPKRGGLDHIAHRIWLGVNDTKTFSDTCFLCIPDTFFSPYIPCTYSVWGQSEMMGINIVDWLMTTTTIERRGI